MEIKLTLFSVGNSLACSVEELVRYRSFHFPVTELRKHTRSQLLQNSVHVSIDLSVHGSPRRRNPRVQESQEVSGGSEAFCSRGAVRQNGPMARLDSVS